MLLNHSFSYLYKKVQNEILMSFTTASAILRGNWLVDKQWANAHMPLVFSFMKGDASAAKMLMGSEDDEADDCCDPVLIGKNIYSIFPGTDLNQLPAGAIAFVDIDGPLFKMGDICTDGMEDYAELFYGIANATNITGVILDLDSPGGQADGTATFGDAIKFCASIKPVIGFVDDGICASAAYWALSACTEIYCSQPTDAVGSIGVYCSIADWNTYYAADGLPIKDVYAPESTDKNIEYRESIAGNDDLLKANLSVIAKAFISTVKTNRKGKIKGTDWATGKMFFASDALSQGLIDGIKSFDQVAFRISRLASQNKLTNIMAFEKTLASAKATEFAVTDEGFLLSEDELNNVEASLATIDEAIAATVALNEAHATIEALNVTVAELTGERDIAQGAITVNMTRIQELQEQVTALGKEPSGKGTVLTSTEDEHEEEGTKPPSYLDENNPINQFADKRVRRK